MAQCCHASCGVSQRIFVIQCVIQSDQSQACYERWRSVLVMNAVVPTPVIGQKKCVGNNALFARSHSGPCQNGTAQVVLGSEFLHYRSKILVELHDFETFRFH